MQTCGGQAIEAIRYDLDSCRVISHVGVAYNVA